MSDDSIERLKLISPMEKISKFRQQQKEEAARIQTVDLDAIRNPSLRMDPEIDSLLRPDLMDSFPGSVPGITVCASSKEGEKSPIGSEDACAFSRDGTRFAISDGVSNSNLPRPFAAMLVQKWVETPIFSPDSKDWQEWLRKPRTAWEIWVAEEWIKYINALRARNGESPKDKETLESIIKESIGRGASATFLGVQVDRQQQSIRALSFGDSCMFLISPTRKIYESFPLNDTSEFTDFPYQILSRKDHLVRGYKEIPMSYDSGDTLVLATDAISKWIMKNLVGDFDETLQILERFNSGNFQEFIEQGWRNRQIGVDDATLMLVTLGSGNQKHIPPEVMPPPLAPRRFRRAEPPPIRRSK